MTQEQRAALLSERSATYAQIMRTTIFAYLAIAAIISFAPEVNPIMLGMLIVATAAYGILSGGTVLKYIAALTEDGAQTAADSHFGKATMSTNYDALTITSAVLLGLIGFAELYAIFG